MGPLRREVLSDADRLRGGGGSHGDAGLLEGHVPARILADDLLGRVRARGVEGLLRDLVGARVGLFSLLCWDFSISAGSCCPHRSQPGC